MMLGSVLIFVLVAALGLALLRSLRGPTLLDRAAGADVASSCVAAILIVLSVFVVDSRKFLDVAWIAVGMGLLSNQVLAYFLAHREWVGHKKENRSWES
jgi:multisubunit Na+/H+ antiporter MnhF subunit